MEEEELEEEGEENVPDDDWRDIFLYFKYFYLKINKIVCNLLYMWLNILLVKKKVSFFSKKISFLLFFYKKKHCFFVLKWIKILEKFD